MSVNGARNAGVNFNVEDSIGDWQTAATIPPVATLEETTATETTVVLMNNGEEVEGATCSNDGVCDCGDGTAPDELGNCPVDEEEANRAELIETLETGALASEFTISSGIHAGTYAPASGLGYYKNQDSMGFIYFDQSYNSWMIGGGQNGFEKVDCTTLPIC